MLIAPGTILSRLNGGLILRTGMPEDADALSQFNSAIHSDSNTPDLPVGAWTKDLLTRPHPTFLPQDFLVVEEPGSGRIVSSSNLIPQTWIYAGIPFAVGRPELVGTHPDYRERGLVRAQFEALHGWCQERGMNVQAITGIPYYYRQFGYEMTLRLGGSKSAWEGALPKLNTGEREMYSFRPARKEDLGFLAELYRQGYERYLVSAQWDEELFRYELEGKSSDNVCRTQWMIITDHENQRVGFLGYSPILMGSLLRANSFELIRGVPWRKIVPAALRFLLSTGRALAVKNQKECSQVGFSLGDNHPAWEAAQEWLQTVKRPYAYYLRVADLGAFIRQIAPVLEKRLANSVWNGYDGTLKISFYRNGLQMSFAQGRFQDVTKYKPQRRDDSQAHFPGHTFLHLLFGHRNLDELQHLYPDCQANDDGRLLLNILFPTAPSDVLPVA